MVIDEEAPTGRPAGALGWAGLANLFYWINRKNGFGGFWATRSEIRCRSAGTSISKPPCTTACGTERGLTSGDGSTAASSGGRLRSARAKSVSSDCRPNAC
jgi:hypothetical protein